MAIAKRLNRSFLLISLLTCVVGFFSIWVTRGITEEFQIVADEILPRVQLLEKLRFAGLRVVSSTSEFAFLYNERAKMSEEEDPLGEEEALIDSGHRLFNEAFVQYRLIDNEEHAHEYLQLSGLLVKFEQLEKTSGEIIAAKKRGAVGAEVFALKERFESEEIDFLTSIDAVIEHKYQELAAGKVQAYAAARTAIDGILLFSLLTFIGAVFASWRIARKISIPLTELCRASNEIGLGRLHTRVNTVGGGAEGDELKQVGDNFNRMAEELERAMMSRGHFEAISEQMKEGLILVSLKGTIQFVNRAAGDLLGYAKAELQGQSAISIFPTPAVAEAGGRGQGRLKKANAGGSTVPVVRKDGVTINVSLTTVPLFAPNGQPDAQAFFFH